jgi:hypothetical protein
MLAGVLVLSLIAVLIEYRTFMKHNKRREIIISGIFMLVGITLSIFRFLKLPIPSPLLVIRFIFQPASQLLNKWLS